MQFLQLGFRQQRIAGAEADLRQPRAGAHDDREGARADLEIERPVIAGGDLVELVAAIGHHAGEDVEPPGRALRVGRGGNVGRQRQAFQQRHDVDAAGFQHRALGEIDLVQLQPVELVGDPVVGAGQEGGAHAQGLVAEPEIEAGRLDLVGIERARRLQRARLEQRRNVLIGKNACLPQRLAPLQGRTLCRRFLPQNRWTLLRNLLGTNLLMKPAIDASAAAGLKGRYPVVIWPVGLQPR